jgi:hypothetical protein
MRPFDCSPDFAEGQTQEAALCPLPTGMAGVKEAGRRTLLCGCCHWVIMAVGGEGRVGGLDHERRLDRETHERPRKARKAFAHFA